MSFIQNSLFVRIIIYQLLERDFGASLEYIRYRQIIKQSLIEYQHFMLHYFVLVLIFINKWKQECNQILQQQLRSIHAFLYFKEVCCY